MLKVTLFLAMVAGAHAGWWENTSTPFRFCKNAGAYVAHGFQPAEGLFVSCNTPACATAMGNRQIVANLSTNVGVLTYYFGRFEEVEAIMAIEGANALPALAARKDTLTTYWLPNIAKLNLHEDQLNAPEVGDEYHGGTIVVGQLGGRPPTETFVLIDAPLVINDVACEAERSHSWHTAMVKAKDLAA